MVLQEQLSQYDLKHMVGPIQIVPLSALNHPLIPEYLMGPAFGVIEDDTSKGLADCPQAVLEPVDSRTISCFCLVCL